MNTQLKLSILADAAKYDASCASSGSIKRDSRSGKGIGSTSNGMGICHSYAPDGRCISLLKILLTNFCLYDCSYCVNRASSQTRRARFSVDEVVSLTLEFYKRNYIEGLFLSSGIIQSSDYTMEQLVLVAKTLRVEHDFKGYIHLKTIPDAAPELLEQAGLYADRLSINVELPSRQSLALYAPEKNPEAISRSMVTLKERIDESKSSRKQAKKVRSQPKNTIKRKRYVFSPAGQSTQMIVGADASSDSKILTLANSLYNKYQMRRVYYSAFSPIPDSSATLPLNAPPLMREHRLYQADWLIRFYGFTIQEISQQSADLKGMLDLDIDPKLAWAINNRALFPVNINTATREMLLRVPGIGTVGVNKILRSRKVQNLRINDLATLGLSIKKISPFIETLDYSPSSALLESDSLKQYFTQSEPQQISLFN
jgi:putative DNA modification/repair radical SAM protein